MDPALRNRLTFGPIMLAALLGLLWLDHWVEVAYGVDGVGLLIILGLILPPAVFELARLFAAEQVRPKRTIAILGAGSLVAHGFLTQFDGFRPIAASTLAFIVVAVMILAAMHRAWLQRTEQAIQNMAGTVLATLYLGGLAWFLVALRVKQSSRPGGFSGTTMVIVMILLTVKFTDIGAFFGGKATGRHKLIPWLSPGKTWEGLFFGILTAGIVGAVCAPWVFGLVWWKGFIFGTLIGLVGQAGDLLESLMKRDAEVKDSGHLIPGFGGVLDVIDSPLLAAPFAYLLFSLF